jgi:hypothetical protein
MTLTKQQMVGILNNKYMNFVNETWLDDDAIEDGIPIWVFNSKLRRKIIGNNEDKEYVENIALISGWLIPPECNYAEQEMLLACDNIGEDLLSSYCALRRANRYCSDRAAMIVQNVECSPSELDTLLDIFPLLRDSLPGDRKIVSVLLSLKDEGKAIMQFRNHDWQCVQNDSHTYVALSFC